MEWKEWPDEDGHLDLVLEGGPTDALICTATNRVGRGDGKMAVVIGGCHHGYFGSAQEAKDYVAGVVAELGKEASL